MSSWVRDKQKHEAISGSQSSKPASRQSPRPVATSPARSQSSRQSPPPSLPVPESRPKSPIQSRPKSPLPTAKPPIPESLHSLPPTAVKQRSPTPRSDLKPSSLTSVEAKRTELAFKHFCNRMELMTKKSLQEYFRLQDLDGSHIVDRLFFAFGKTNSIDFASFLAGIGVLAKGSPMDRAGFIFRMLDIKAASIVDRNDLKKMLLSYLTAALSIETDNMTISQVQAELRDESVQEIEQTVDEIVDEAVARFGAHGSFLTLEQFQQYVLSDPAVARALEAGKQ